MKVDAKTLAIVLAIAWFPANIAGALVFGKPTGLIFLGLAVAPIVLAVVGNWLALVTLIRSPEEFAMVGVFGIPFTLWMFGTEAGLIVVAVSVVWLIGINVWARMSTPTPPASGATYTGGLLLEPRRRRPGP